MTTFWALYFHGIDKEPPTWMHDNQDRVYTFKVKANADLFREKLLSAFEKIEVLPYDPGVREWINWELEEALEQGRRIRESA